MSLNRMWLLIVKMNGTDGNNNNTILYVVVNYIIIKYLYINIICFFCQFFVYSYFTDIFRFILLKVNWFPRVSNGVKYLLKICNLLFTNGRRTYYIQWKFSDKVISHSWSQKLQYPTILIAWLSFSNESINCTKVIFLLMSFSISKSSFSPIPSDYILGAVHLWYASCL